MVELVYDIFIQLNDVNIMSKNVTDRLLLKAIHDTYYSEFCDYDKNFLTVRHNTHRIIN